MELRVLGCWAPYPAPGGAMSGYLVQHGRTSLLLDGGSGVASRLQQYLPIESLRAVIVSHLHEDHISDIHCLRFIQLAAIQAGRTTDRLQIWAPAEPVEQRRWLESGEQWVDLRTYDPGRPLILDDLQIEFVPTTHAVPTWAMRIQPVGGGPILFYGADTGWDDSLIEAARGADLLLVEASLDEAHAHMRWLGHMTATEAARLAKEAGVKRTILTHIHPTMDRVQLLKEAQSVWPRAELVQQDGLYVL
jgi:ribonuclease BN (tRNA processing enzyme)